MSYTTPRNCIVCFLALLISLLCASATAQQHITGTLPDGATYVIDVPANWNGVLLLYSHGYVVPGSPNPAQDVGDPLTGGVLLNAGYALAGSSYAHTGWAVQEGIPDQMATLGVFQQVVGTPIETIAWGHSLGGMITAGLVQNFPASFNGALPMCGVLAGSVGVWNEVLDGAFAFNTLVAGKALQVVHITDPQQNLTAAEAFLVAAQATPQGQARLALVAALGDLPGWFDPTSEEPDPTDYGTREMNQFLWMQNVTVPFMFALRAELEFRAGGNPSWNTGVNYKAQLARSIDSAEVQALYAAAGLSLDDDLAALNKAARIAADPGAEQYLIQNITYNGQIPIPVLTMHTIGDGLVTVENERAYKNVVERVQNYPRLREIFVHRAGHCEFTPAETLTAFQRLSSRLITGKWGDLGDAVLNAEAAALGPNLNVLLINGQLVPVAPAFLDYSSPAFLRPFNAFSQ
jgi:pimeloyl-ACP methyl ester carboxylesterase